MYFKNKITMTKLSSEKVAFFKKFLTTKEYAEVAESVGYSQSMVSSLFNGAEIRKKHKPLIDALENRVNRNIKKLEKEIEKHRNNGF